MVSNKAAGLKKEKKISSQANQVGSPQKEIHDSCAFSLVDNNQKQHMQPTEMLKKKEKSQYLVKMADFKNLFTLQFRKISIIIFKCAPVSE